MFLQMHPLASAQEVLNALVRNSTQGLVKHSDGAPNRILYTGFLRSESSERGDTPAALSGDIDFNHR
jgi:hypothetical protein